MRALIVLVCAVLSFSACSKEVKLVPTASSLEAVRIEDRTMIEMRLSKTDLTKYVDAQDGVWQETRTAGMLKLFNKILNRDVVIAPVAGMAPLGDFDGSYTQTGVLDMAGDEETGDIVQTFMISAGFAADMDLGGQIVSIEEDRYLAGMHDVFYGVLYNVVPQSLPAYVAIAERIGELGSNLHRVIGMAEVKQVMQDKVALSQAQGSAVGTLCSFEVVVSDREIEAEDLIFLLTANIAALDAATAASIDDEPETVVVLPPHADAVQEPAEMK